MTAEPPNSFQNVRKTKRGVATHGLPRPVKAKKRTPLTVLLVPVSVRLTADASAEGGVNPVVDIH